MAAGDHSPALLELVHEIVRTSGAGGAVFSKNCTDLVRKIALLRHLFEEIRDFGADLGPPEDSSGSSSPSSSLSDLEMALQSCKRVLEAAGKFDPSASSNGEAKRISFQFQCVARKLAKALGCLEYDLFNISDDVREQVELVSVQLRRATKLYEPLNSKAISCALSQPLGEAIDLIQSGGRPVESLHFDEAINDSEKLRISSPLSEACQSGDIGGEKAGKLATKSSGDLKKPDQVTIPDDFICPISLELMRDPVIVATGQTYERSFIQRWIDSGNLTCPKTRQKLQHLALTPNFVLKSVISQWCTENNIEQPTGLANGKIKKSDGSYWDVSKDIMAIEALVCKLSSESIEERRAATAKIRSLSKRSTDNRIILAETGAISVLVKLLNTDDVLTQENAVTSILNLSIYENNKELITVAGAIPLIIQVLRVGSMEARENAAAALFSLSLADENKSIIGASGALPALVELLRNGSVRGKKDSATALFNLCIHQGNKVRAVRAGIIPALSKMLTDPSSCMVDESLAILSVLASHREARIAISKVKMIPVLANLLRIGFPRSKENASAILLSLCKRSPESLGCLSRLDAAIPLNEIATSGTERARGKATLLLELLQKSQML